MGLCPATGHLDASNALRCLTEVALLQLQLQLAFSLVLASDTITSALKMSRCRADDMNARDL